MTPNSNVNATNSVQIIDPVLQAQDQESRTTSEKYMASLWMEIIGLDRVLLSHKFLDVGGNSLTLNVIVSRIQAETGVSLDPPLFFDDERSSLFELAKELDVLLAGKQDSLR